MKPIRIKVTPAAASATNIAGSQSPGTTALTLTTLAAGPIDSAITGTNVNGVNLGLGRIIGITSGSNDSSIYFTVVGTDQNGLAVSENVTGASGAPGTAVTVNYYTSVSSITPSGAGAAGTVTAGTVNTTASAQLPLLPLDFYGRIGAIVQVDVSNTISYTVQQTFDDCISANATPKTNTYFATPAAPTALTAQSAAKYTQLTPGVCGIAVTIPTYTTTGSITLNVVAPSNANLG